MRARFSFRARILLAMIAVAAGVLALAGATTYVIVQSTAEEAALDDLRAKADELTGQAEELRQFSVRSALRPPRLPSRGDTLGTGDGAGFELQQFLKLVSVSLRLAEARIVYLSPGGELLAPDELGPAQRALGDPAQFATLPTALTETDLDAERLLAGGTVTGSTDGTVYLQQPLDPLPARSENTPVLVLTQDVDTDVIGDAGPAFLVAAGIALLVCIGVSLWLARRLTRPLRAIEETARVLGDGDLSARVRLPNGTEQELVALARTLDALATRLEAARGAERQFLLSISHDLRTPLTSIRGYAEALADGTLDGEDASSRQRAAAVIGAEARRLERLVRDLLDLSRLDSHEFSLRPRPCDAATVVREAAEAFVPQARDLGIALAVDATEPVPADLDSERLAQVVANLVENAMKYATASVEVAVRPDERGRFAVSVVDDGPGIPDAELPHVFERLYTARGAAGRAVGTGLGLAIVRDLTVAMGGDVRAERVDGAGSRFVVTLPMAAVPTRT